ncbi:hypothetical protein BDR07DRAFT_1492365 [Suillus spraguei]|nr:hypothetical protein BDR07DRAFT_1492365 [Suillus spraguei]
MSQSTSHPSSYSDNSSRATQYMSNTGMDMSHLPWTHLGYTPAQFSVPPHIANPAAAPYAPAMPDNSPETTLTEVAEVAPNPDSIQDTVLVGLPPQRSTETSTFGGGLMSQTNLWILSFPSPSPPSSRSLETMLAEAAGGPDVWMFINKIERFVDPELPSCMSLTDAADPDFCNFPIRTLLICSWLNNYYGDAQY